MVYKLKASCSKDKLTEIRNFVSKVLESQPISEIEAHKVVLAVDEVCANLIIHSHNCNPSETIEIRIDRSDNIHLIFEIIDHGIGFNIEKYKEPSLSEIIKNKRKGGIGLMLVNRIMDRIEFDKKNDKNVCRLVKKLRSGQVS